MNYHLTEKDVKKLRRMGQKFDRLNPQIKRGPQPTPQTLGGSVELVFGKADADIIPDTTTGTATIWDHTVSPPTATTEQVTDLTLDWLTDQQISAGREIVWASIGGFNRILWAQCEPEQIVTTAYTLGAPINGISPGVTERITMSAYIAPEDPDFTLVGTDVIQANREMLIEYAVDSSLEYDVGNNGEVFPSVSRVVIGTPPPINPVDVSLLDSFQSSRSGVFPRNLPFPNGFFNVEAGGQFAFEVTNLGTSTGDLNFVGMLLTLVPS